MSRVATDLGTNTYEVSYHVGARPSHQPWQGRVWTMEQLQSVCGLGTVTGLHGANCYHDYSPFIPGVSTRTYTDDQLQEMLDEENTPKDYYGKSYTTYEALQEQRKMERNMRATRQQVKLLQGGQCRMKRMLSSRKPSIRDVAEIRGFFKGNASARAEAADRTRWSARGGLHR